VSVENPSDYELTKGLSALGDEVQETGDYIAERCGCEMFLLAGKPCPPCNVHGWGTKWARKQ
jgi:hypothetical protein